MDNDLKKFESNGTLVEFLLILIRYKKRIFLGTTIVMIISIVLYFFVFDLIYYSSATIKSTGKSPSFLMGLDGLGDLGGISDIVGGTSSSKELSLYMEILSSRRSLEPLIVKFGVMEKEEIKFMEDAVKMYQKERVVMDFDKLSGILTIGVFDKDPNTAKAMTEFLIEELNKINIELSVQNAKNNREFIEKRYLQAKLDLSSAEDSLKSFQMIYGVAPDLQIKASAQSLYSLEAELKAEEVKLDVLKKMLSADQPEVKLQEAKVTSLNNKITEIRTSTDIDDVLSLGNSPIIAINFLRLQREVEIQSKIITFMLPVFEQAKIEEKRETPTIIVLDKPYVAERKTKPKRLTMVVVSTLLAFILFSITSIAYEVYLKRFFTLLRNKS